MKDIIIYDKFYENPYEIREGALSVFKTMINEKDLYLNWHFQDYSGSYDTIPGIIRDNETIMGRSFETSSYYSEYHKTIFEKLLNSTIQYNGEKNGIFVLNNCLSNPIPMNINKNSNSIITEWIGIVFLTPDPPLEGGITINNYKKLNINSLDSLDNNNELLKNLIVNEIYSHRKDTTYWETDTKIANVYNRLILIKKNIFYKSSLNFGIRLNDSRLTQFFSFGVLPN